MKPTCACSYQALTALIHDLAGVTLVHPPPRVPPPRPIASSRRNSSNTALSRSSSRQFTTSIRRTEARSDEGSEASENSQDAESTTTQVEGIKEASLEGIGHGEDAPSAASQEQSAMMVREDATPPSTQSVQKSRVENRLQRKLRRIEAGTYKAQSVTRTREKIEKMDEDRVKSVLSLMKAARGDPGTAEGAEEQSQLLQDRAADEPAQEDFVVETEVETTRTSGSSDMTGPKASAEQSSTVSKNKKEAWQVQKTALKRKFGEQGWQPRKRLSPDTLDGIRALQASDPAVYTTQALAAHFQVTPEAVRRILKSKWQPTEAEADSRRARWERRGERKWQAMAEEGVRPPAKWRAKGITTPQAKKKRERQRGGFDHVRWDTRAERAPTISLAGRI